MESLKDVAKRAATEMERITNALPAPCNLCNGTQVQVVPGKGARPCPECYTPESRYNALVAQMDARYRDVRLTTLIAQPGQAKLIASMQANPLSDYYIYGRNDSGKTHLAWALYEHAASIGRGVMFFTLADLAQKFRDSFNTGTRVTLLSDLQQDRHPWSVFIDDIDKARATEYVAELLFSFVDSIYRNKHQLVVTSQLDPEKSIDGRMSLVEHFEQADPRYGVGIVRRIVNDQTAVWMLF